MHYKHLSRSISAVYCSVYFDCMSFWIMEHNLHVFDNCFTYVVIFPSLWCVNFLQWFKLKIKTQKRRTVRGKQATFFSHTILHHHAEKKLFPLQLKTEQNETERKFCTVKKSSTIVLIWHDNDVWISNGDYCGNVDHERQTMGTSCTYRTCLWPLQSTEWE